MRGSSSKVQAGQTRASGSGFNLQIDVLRLDNAHSFNAFNGNAMKCLAESACRWQNDTA